MLQHMLQERSLPGKIESYTCYASSPYCLDYHKDESVRPCFFCSLLRLSPIVRSLGRSERERQQRPSLPA